jgi:hypothetical protein
VRVDGDLGAAAGLAGHGLDLDDALGDLRHFRLEQAAQEIGVGARQDDLRAARHLVHIEHDGPHVVVLAVVIPRDLLARRQETLAALELDDDVAAVHLLHDAAHQGADLVGELLIDALPLGLAHALDEHLLGGLDGVAAELLERQRIAQRRSDFEMGIDDARFRERDLRHRILDHLHDFEHAEERDAPGRIVEHHLNAGRRAELLAPCRDQSGLERLDQVLTLDALLARDLTQGVQDLVIHSCSSSY